MLFTYRVDCWVRPRSGFDLAKKNSSLSFIKKFATTFEGPFNNTFKDLISSFEKVSEGYVIKSLKLESDSLVTSLEKELLPEIQKEYPEAKIISWSMLPVHVEEIQNYAE